MSLLTPAGLPSWILQGRKRPPDKGKGEESDIDAVSVFERLDRLEAKLRAALAALQATKRQQKVASGGYLYFQPRETLAGGMEMSTNMPYLFDYRYANQTRGEGGVYQTQFAYGIDGAILTDSEGVFFSWKRSIQKALPTKPIDRYRVEGSVQAALARGPDDQYHVFYHGLIYDGPPKNTVGYEYGKSVNADMGAFYPLNLKKRNADEMAIPVDNLRKTWVYIHAYSASPSNARVYVNDPSKVAAALTVFVYHELQMIHFGIVFIVPPTMPRLVAMGEIFDVARQDDWTLFKRNKKFRAAAEAMVQAEAQYLDVVSQERQLPEMAAAAEEDFF